MSKAWKIGLITAACILLILIGVIEYVSYKVDSTTENIKDISNSKGIVIIDDVMKHPEEKGKAVGTFLMKVREGYDSAFHKKDSIK